jgi:hypothetical protein
MNVHINVFGRENVDHVTRADVLHMIEQALLAKKSSPGGTDELGPAVQLLVSQADRFTGVVCHRLFPIPLG